MATKYASFNPKCHSANTPNYLEYMHITDKREFSPHWTALDTALMIHNMDPQPHPYTLRSLT